MAKPSISQHFVNLGAPLRNVVNSWGAVRESDGAVFLRVWRDRRRQIDVRWFRQLLHKASELKVGYVERIEHIDLIRAGAPAYMVIVTAADPEASPRKIGSYTPDRLVPIGELVEIDGEVWGECLPPVATRH
ncbi:conserved protein of unknown function [Pseudomonas marincola]|uniref:Uncharacterized protein n=1 Tax=Pseudomonas marincola TaxID=437900 RepID=A0A653DXP5_9PSED|nr:hypothetical protein [Pseudomonas marincola]CAE6931814.1 conserved protein of unknown function [Pseudomonas marincola]